MASVDELSDSFTITGENANKQPKKLQNQRKDYID